VTYLTMWETGAVLGVEVHSRGREKQGTINSSRLGACSMSHVIWKSSEGSRHLRERKGLVRLTMRYLSLANSLLHHQKIHAGV